MTNNGKTIEVEDLVKVYSGGTKAVAGISFAVGEGEFFGFLGPNGAGKTTTMKILGTLLRKTSGNVVVAGHSVDEDAHKVRCAIGFAMQEVGLDDLASGRDFLIMQGLLYGISSKESRRRADELLELVDLTSVAQRKVGTYSGGMRRRIDLAGALVHKPRVLFLDEPTTGLDPQSRLAVWDHLKDLNRQGVTIFLTTQMLEEADQLCERIAIIDLGRIVAEGTPDGLKSQVGADMVTISIDSGDGEKHQEQQEKARTLIGKSNYVEEVTLVEEGLSVCVKDGSSALPHLMRLLGEHNITVTNLTLSRPTLDDVFIKYTGRNIRADEGGGDGFAQAMRPWMGLGRR